MSEWRTSHCSSPHRIYIVGIGDIDLDHIGLAVLIEEGLGLLKRHEDEGVVEGRHANLENRRNRIALHARRDAERRLRAMGRDDRDLVTGPQAQMLGKLGADRHALAGIKAVERALDDMPLDSR